MTLRNRIALTFSFITTVTFSLVLVVIYLFFSRYTGREFLQRLQERAVIVTQYRLEQDELPDDLLNQLRLQSMRTLVEERAYFFPLDNESAPIPATLVGIGAPPDLIRQVKEQKYVEFFRFPMMAVAIRYDDNQGDFAAVITAHDRYGESKLNNLRLVMLLALLFYLLVVFFVGRWYAQSVLNPLSHVIERMQLINTSNLYLRLREGQQQKDELQQLTRTFNDMLDRLETAVEAQQHFISNASHQLNNPLTAILGEVETALARDHSQAEYRQSLQRVEEEGQRLRTLVLQLLQLAHMGGSVKEGSFTEWRIDEMLFELVDEFKQQFPNRHLRIDFSGFPTDADQLTINAHRNLLKIAFSNIIENAFKFSTGSDVTIGLRFSGNSVRVDITDLGIGIPESDRSKIFDPFFRAGNVRHLPGFGIGLPMVQKIIQLHHGSISLRPGPGSGTVFFIDLPRF